jgi:hypothetical protein
MSTITVEDGTGVTNANSYVTIANVDDYVTALGNDAITSNDWQSLTDDQKGEAIIVAAQYLERMVRWYGLPYFPSRPIGNTPSPKAQTMAWPRTKMHDSHGGAVAPGTIPSELKQAQMFLTLQFCKDPSEAQVTIENVSPLKNMKIGPIAMDFTATQQDSAVTQFSGTRFPYVEFLLKNMGVVRDETDVALRKTENLY